MRSLKLISIALVFLVSVVSAVGDANPGTSGNIQIQLDQGWNLLYGLVEVSDISAGGSLTASDVVAIYAFLPEKQLYAELYPNVEWDALREVQGAADLDQQSAFWVYSKRAGTISYNIREPLPIQDIKLKRGWNIVSITESFRGHALVDVLGNCDIERGFVFSDGKWKSISEFKKDKNQLMSYNLHGIAFEVEDDCSFALPKQSAPAIPSFPQFPEEDAHGIELIAPTVDNDPMLGERKAPVTIIVFDDYQGPFNARFYQETFPQLKKEYIDTGKVRYVVRDFPLDSHTHARTASLAANCILALGNSEDFWKFHSTLFPNQDVLNNLYVKQLAQSVLSYGDNEIDSCIDSKMFNVEIENDIKDAKAAGVDGTPTFFINDRKIAGAQPYVVFKDIIEQELKA